MKLKTKELVKRIFSVPKTIFGLTIYSWFVIVIVKDGLEADRSARIAKGIFWLVCGTLIYLLACIKPLMLWMYEKRSDLLSGDKKFDEFVKSAKDNIKTGFFICLIYIILAFFY